MLFGSEFDNRFLQVFLTDLFNNDLKIIVKLDQPLLSNIFLL
jgi:hypothetical protein